MEIQALLDQIKHTCKQHLQSGDWSKIHAMRYAYVTLGREISKSARFFFSVEGKYGEHGLSVEEMKQIHYADKGYEVTCYVSAKMLKNIFDDLEINSNILQSASARPYVSNGDTLDIYHSYLVCETEDKKKYFLSLNSDLVNIKLNAAPEHFAVEVPYIYNGQQNYQGPEIEHSSLSPLELLEIDKKIGYAIPVKNPSTGETAHVYSNITDVRHDTFGKQKLPYDYYFASLPKLDGGFSNGFDALFSSFKRPDGTSKTNFSELTTEEFRNLEWFVYRKTMNHVKTQLGITSNDELKTFYEMFQGETLDLDKLKKAQNKFIADNSNDSNKAVRTRFETQPYTTMALAIKFIVAMENLVNAKNNPNLTDTQKRELHFLYTENKRGLAERFVEPKDIAMYTGKATPTNKFLSDKIKDCLTQDFEVADSAVSPYRPAISKMEAVEQAKFLKEYLRSILKTEFPEDSQFMERIMFSALAENTNPNKIAFLIHVKDDNPNNPNFSAIYNPKNNTFNTTNFLEIVQKYKILSKTLYAHLSRPLDTTIITEPEPMA